MPTSVNDSGTWRSIKNIYRNDSGTWRLIDSLYVNDSGTWRKVHEKLKATLSTNIVDVSGSSPATTPSVTVTAAGGWPTYSYSWSLITGFYPIPPTIDSPSSDTTAFTLTAAISGSYYATFKCTVTDSIGQTVDTSTVTATWDIS